MGDEKSIVFYFVVAGASKVDCIMLMLFMQRYFLDGWQFNSKNNAKCVILKLRNLLKSASSFGNEQQQQEKMIVFHRPFRSTIHPLVHAKPPQYIYHVECLTEAIVPSSLL